MQIQLPHKLSRDAAKKRINDMLVEHKSQIAEHATDVTTAWDADTLSFSFTAQGQSFSGTVAIDDTQYDVYVKLPLRYKLFEGMIERQIKSEMVKLGL